MGITFLLTPGYVLFLVYEAMIKRNPKSLFLLSVLSLHAGFIAKRSKIVRGILELVDFKNWHKSLRVIQEEDIGTEGALFAWMPHSILAYTV